MSTPLETQSPRERSWIYVTACVILGIMVVWAMFAFSSHRETKRAEDKADQLITALQDAGYRTPDKDQIVRVLGDDGGATCDNPNKALGRATLLALSAPLSLYDRRTLARLLLADTQVKGDAG